MDEYNLNGFIPEPDSPKHWGYEERLSPHLPSLDPEPIDLRPFTSPRHNQKQTGSCVAQSVVKALEIKRIMKYGHEAHQDLSVMAVYYLARTLMLPRKTNQDSGTQISLACDVLRRFGVCPEEEWPFEMDRLFRPVSWKAMRKAYQHRIDSFYKIRSTGGDRVLEIQRCLRAGHPVVYGTNVGHNWTRYKAGEVLGPVSDTDRRGRHATCLVGFENGNFIGENSWGEGWGDDGFYLASPELIGDETSRDFWVILAGWEDSSDRSSQ